MVSLGTQPANRKSGFGHSSPTGARAQDLSRQPARPDLWGARVSNDPGLPDRVGMTYTLVNIWQVLGWLFATGLGTVRATSPSRSGGVRHGHPSYARRLVWTAPGSVFMVSAGR